MKIGGPKSDLHIPRDWRFNLFIHFGTIPLLLIAAILLASGAHGDPILLWVALFTCCRCDPRSPSRCVPPSDWREYES